MLGAMRWLRYGLAALLGVVLVLVAGTMLAVRLWGPQLARERVEDALGAALGREVRVERVDVQPWRGRAVVAGVSARAHPGEPGPNFLTLARVEANLGISSLWHRRIVLRSIRLDDLDLRVRGRDGPPLRELPILPEVLRAGPLEIALGPIELRRGQLLYEDPSGLRVAARGLAGIARPGRATTGVTLAADDIAIDTAASQDRLGPLTADLIVAPTALEIRDVSTSWQTRRLTLAGVVRAPFDAPALDLAIRGEVDLASLGRRLGVTQRLAGVARANARLVGTTAAPRATASVAIDALTAATVNARAVAAQVVFAGGVVSVNQLTARAFGGSLTGEATLEPAHLERAHVTARLRDVDSAALEALAGVSSGLTARVDAEAEARGDLRDLVRARLHVRATARDVRLPPPVAALGTGTVTAEVRGERGAFDIASGVATWPGLQLHTQGRATLDGPAPLRVKLTGELTRLAPLLGTVRIAGDAALEGELTGRWRDPSLTGRLDVRSPVVADQRADALATTFALTSRALRLTDASIRLGQAQLLASGTLTWPTSITVALPDPGAVSLDVLARTQNARLQDAAPWLPPTLRDARAAVLVTAKLDGTLAAWRAVGHAESATVSLPSAPPVRGVAVSFEATPERLDVPALRASVLDAPLSAKGRWRWAAAGEVEAEAGPLDLARVPDVPESLRLQGRARATVTATVRNGRVAGSARVNGDGVAVAGFQLGRGVADLTSDGATLRGEATFPESRIAATGQGRLDGTTPIATRITATNLEIEPLLRTYRPDLVGTLTGQFTAIATLDVPARDPRATRGVIQLEPVRFEAGGERWEARGPIVVRREPGRLTLERLEVAGRLGSATAAGFADDAGTLDGTLRGQAPLTLLSVFRPEIREAAGRLDLDVRVGGTTAKPNLVGRGTISGGLLALRDTPLVVRDIEARIVLSPSRLRVEDLQARLGAGTVKASGEAGLDGGTIGAYQAAITARGVNLAAVEGLETSWNAEATVTGRGGRGIVRGQAHLVRGSYTRDLSIVPMLLQEQAREQPLDWGRELALQIDLYLDENLVVRTPQAQLRAGGTLHLHGTLTRPIILGSIEAQDGRLTFRRNRFTIENAFVRFDDPRRLNPHLDVRATTRIRTYDVTMWLTGRVEDLSIRLSSEPPLPQEDLLALVTLGSTRAELGSSGGLTFAGEAAQLMSRELLGLEPSAPLVDVLDFSKSDTGQNQFRVGKRLGDKTTVIYSGSFAEGGQRKLRVEYQILGPLLLAGEQAFGGGYGGDVIVRLRFR
jgi:autotransporter translocation and assembly factor TamB